MTNIRTFTCQGCGKAAAVLYGARLKCRCGVTSAAEIFADTERRGIRTTATAVQAARFLNGCSESLDRFCDHPDCRCRRTFEESSRAR